MIPAKIQKPIYATTTAPPLELVTRPREQQREFVSFLTWPFVLAQVLAAERILDGTNSAALAGEDEFLPVRSRPNEAMGSDDYAPASNWANRKTTEENAREPTTDATATADIADDRSELAGNTTRAPERVNDDGPQDKDPSINGASGGIGTASRPAKVHAESIDGSEADGASGPVNLVIDIVQPSVIAATDVAVDIADITGHAIGDVGDIVQSVGGTLVPTVNTVTDLTVDALGIAGGVLHSTASAIDTVISPVGAELELAPLVATVEHAVEELAAGLSDESSGGLLGSGGVITFSDGQSVQLPADDLFVDGRHTDYGLVLRTVATEIIGSATDDVDPESHAGDHVTPHAAGDGEDAQSYDVAQPAYSAPPMTVELTSVLDDVVIRGSDSLI